MKEEEEKEGDKDDLRLLLCGERLVVPDVQRVGVVTEDELRAREACVRALAAGRDGALLRARLQAPQLASDMAAFKAANARAVFADFVRWYSPPDWRGPRAHGTLSPRMAAPGNPWAALWDAARAVPAAAQAPLYDAAAHAQKALHYLETLAPADLLAQLAAAALAAVHRVFAAPARAYAPTPALPCRAATAPALAAPLAAFRAACEACFPDPSNDVIVYDVKTSPEEEQGQEGEEQEYQEQQQQQQHQEQPFIPPSEEQCERICRELAGVEVAGARLTSVLAKIGARFGAVADGVVRTGSAPLASDDERGALRDLVGDIDDIVPDRREYDISVRATAPEFGTGFCHAVATVAMRPGSNSTSITEDLSYTYITTGDSVCL